METTPESVCEEVVSLTPQSFTKMTIKKPQNGKLEVLIVVDLDSFRKARRLETVEKWRGRHLNDAETVFYSFAERIHAVCDGEFGYVDGWTKPNAMQKRTRNETNKKKKNANISSL
uniref:Uncharacterized protein n=1 Tax=viral metagenome TaxID=1070528 RepID=A0A6M3JK61_9ZZZZ